MYARVLVPVIAVLSLSACGDNQTAQQTPPAQTAPAGQTAGGTTTTTTPGTSGAAQTAAAPANLQAFQSRTYTAGPVTVQLNPDNTFLMTQVNGTQKVEGRWAYQEGVVTFSEPKGDVGEAKFPMRCRFEASGGNFRLLETAGTCIGFKDLTFRPAAG